MIVENVEQPRVRVAWESVLAEVLDNVTCPFCGLLCDDLRVEIHASGLRAETYGCPKASAGFLASSRACEPQIAGRPAPLEQAIDRAAQLLGNARAPLISGLQTDVNGARAALRLAEHIGAAVDHSASQALLRNVQVVQRDGWVTTTFSEVRNRADMVVLFGTQLFDSFPRLLERVILPAEALVPERLANRKIWLVGPWQRSKLPGALAEISEIIEVKPNRFAEFVNGLRALRANRSPNASHFAGVERSQVLRLADAIGAADYAVLAWAAGDLGPAPQATLTVDMLAALIRDENEDHRVAGLPLAGNGGDITVNQVCTWLFGVPLRTSFAAGFPDHAPERYETTQLLAGKHCDALLWLASLTPDCEPPEAATSAATVVLGHPAMRPRQTPAVFIPVGIPGIDHTGHLYRSDSVVSLPLRKLRHSGMPSATMVIDELMLRLRN